MLKVVFVTYNRVAMVWETDEPVPPGTVFTVGRSEADIVDFKTIATTGKMAYIDRVNLMTKNRNMSYRVSFWVNGEEVSATADIYGTPSDEVIRLQKRERFQLMKYDGVPAYLYIRHSLGPDCPVCVGAKEHGEMGNNCTRCFGTGKDHGFHTPIPIYIAYHSLEGVGENLQENYVKEPGNTTFWTSNWCNMDPSDIIIEAAPPNTVYRVTGVQQSMRRRAIVRQIISANVADKGTAVYHLPIPDFPWPEREEMFFHDWSEPPRDFHTVFEELMHEHFSRFPNQDLRYPRLPAAHEPAAQEPAGERNAATGRYE